MPAKAIGIAALVVGVILIVFGINASESFASEVNEAVTGNPTDRAMWLIVGGAALGIVGLVTLARGGRVQPA